MSSTNKPRLRDLVPHAVATEAFATVCAELNRKVAALKTVHALETKGKAGMTRSPLYRSVLELATYAQTGTHSTGLDVQAAIAGLSIWFPESDLLQPVPQTSLALVVAAAQARELLADSEPLTVPALHALTGLDRDHLTRLAQQDAIPGAYRSDETKHRPWKFRPSDKLRAWIELYMSTPDQEALHGTTRA